jgi:hypothetical protein
MISLSGIGIWAEEEGISIATTSFARNLVVKMKNVNNRNATSHMAVISIVVDLLGIFTFGMVD